jgi:hypothetical protein
MEMMHYEAGVRVVAVGGRPTTGPMQAPSGSRGARLYSTDTLDANINFTQVILSLESPPSPNVTFLPNRTQALDVYVTYASINLRDQVRNTSTIPIQFAYEAADCRIFYTPQTIYNYTALWQYAADAIWSKPSLCVSGSTGFSTTGTNRTDFTGPPASVSSSATNLTTYLKSLNTSSLPYLTKLNDGILDGGLRISNSNTGKPCTTTADCNPGSACAPVTTCLTSGKQGVQKQCVPTCRGGNTRCGQGAICKLQQPVCAAGNGGKCLVQQPTFVTVGSQRLQEGVCPPPPAAQKCGVVLKSGFVNVGPPPPVRRGGA